MPGIYRIAARALVFLSPEADDSQLTIEMVKQSRQLNSATIWTRLRAYPGTAYMRRHKPRVSILPRPMTRCLAWRAFWRRA